MIKEMLKKLTSNYKTKDSNIEKLFAIIGKEFEEIKINLDKVDDYRDIDTATGKTLDLIGKNVAQERIGNDEMYRQFIKIKIRSNLSAGDIETLIEVLNVMLRGSLVSVQETWKLEEWKNEPAGLLVTFKQSDLIPLDPMERVRAGGVRIYWLLEWERSKFKINTATTAGEKIILYPYFPGDIETQDIIGVCMAIPQSADDITIYPKGAI